MELYDTKIAIVGLGYVGLPLAVAFGKSSVHPVIGFDIDKKKIQNLQKGIDATAELSSKQLKESNIVYSYDPAVLGNANFIIVAVPTPITHDNEPDLRPLESASHLVGQHMTKGTTVVFESTVYPGVTEEVCAPIIEKESKLQCGTDWFVGYSPERINPGDKEHTIEKIVKIVSGMNPEVTKYIAEVYSTVVHAGVHAASSIQVAEAAKVVENIQRDVNIALMNELSIIFEKLGLHTKEVLAAAGTKWNFHHYTPGLVGGHCISVDPYYLTYRVEQKGYRPEIIPASRRINDYMPRHIADIVADGLLTTQKKINESRVLMMGLTFKENIRDTRNSKTRKLIQTLQQKGIQVLGHDPLLSEQEVCSFGVEYAPSIEKIQPVDAIVVCCVHQDFLQLTATDFQHISNGRSVFFDVKGYYDTLRNNSEFLYHSL
ncbi:MAG TPA: nucleotide sugar dehydrogenase [Patescibacteria group bacterium]|nr:nucleotide sugar dehydrogenase [Patescibacteria group bacterium]